MLPILKVSVPKNVEGKPERKPADSHLPEKWLLKCSDTKAIMCKYCFTDSYPLLCEVTTLNAVQYVAKTRPLLPAVFLCSVFAALSRELFQLNAQIVKPIAFKVLHAQTGSNHALSQFTESTWTQILLWRCLLGVCTNYRTHTHTHTQPFTGPLCGTTRVSQYNK